MCVYRVSQKKVTNRIRQKRFNLLSLLPWDMALVDFRSNGATMLFVCLHIIISINSFFGRPVYLICRNMGFEIFEGILQHTKPKDDQWVKDLRSKSLQWWIALEFSWGRSIPLPWHLLCHVLRGTIYHRHHHLNHIDLPQVFEILIDLIANTINFVLGRALGKDHHKM